MSIVNVNAFCSSSIEIESQELLIIENDDQFIKMNQIILRRINIDVKRNEIDVMKKNKLHYFIKHVFDIRIQTFKFIDKLTFFQAELKISVFERNFLIFKLLANVQSCSFLIFVNVFEFYRNMYKSLIEVYLFSASLFIQERQKNQNNFVLILKSYEINFNIIFNCFRIDMKTLDRDCNLTVKRHKQFVWTSIIVYFDDMKQQQKSVECLEFKITYNCRFCDADKTNREDFNQDFILHECYHYEILNRRKKAFLITEKVKKQQFFTRHEMTLKASALADINSILNVVLNFSSNSAHSEYFELICRLYSKLDTLVLISIVFQEFNDVFQRFSFSFE